MPNIQAEIKRRKPGDVAKHEDRRSKQEQAAVDRALRRQAVALLVQQGLSQQEIARALYCSQATVSYDIAYLRAAAEEADIPQGGFTLPAEPGHTKDDYYTDITVKSAHSLSEQYALRDIAAQQFRRFKEKKQTDS